MSHAYLVVDQHDRPLRLDRRGMLGRGLFATLFPGRGAASLAIRRSGLESTARILPVRELDDPPLGHPRPVEPLS